MTKLSDKRENFCQIYCSNGFNAADAYNKAYPKCKANWNRLTNRLMSNDVIKRRIEEIKAEIAEKQDITKEKQIERINLIYAKAVEKGDIKAALTALDQLNKYVGLYEADNEQRREQAELTELQKADLQEFIEYKHRKLLRQVG